MTGRPTIFSKVTILIILLLIPILTLYFYSNRTSMKVIENEIQSSGLNRLSFFVQQFDLTVEQLAMFPSILRSDPYLRNYMNLPMDAGVTYERVAEQERIRDRLSLQSVSSSWTNDLTVFLPKEEIVLSSNLLMKYMGEDLEVFAPLQGWTYDPAKRSEARQPGARFVRQIVDPYGATALSKIRSMIQVSFSTANISAMLDAVKAGGNGDPFFYRYGMQPIGSSTMNETLVAQWLPVLNKKDLSEQGRFVMELEGRRYAVFYTQSKQLGWHLIDYVPLSDILAPIHKANTLFYFTIGLLVMMSCLAAYFLYRNVQRPIYKLVQGVQRLMRGDLSARLHYKPHNEFDYLFARFNEMAEQIQDLIERVYAEKLRLNEATMKQLQAQINPHFLYNSLFFVVNTALLGDNRSVVAMAQNLAEYCRYTTRMETQMVPLREEIKLVESYLTIHNLRMQHLHYEIDISESMFNVEMPRLLLQPIVENAIVHGVEGLPGDGLIRVTGRRDNGRFSLCVEDNGEGMSQDALNQLVRQLQGPMDSDFSCGLWNVHQRLKYMFGEDAGLSFSASELGGLCVTLSWKEAQTDGTAVNRG